MKYKLEELYDIDLEKYLKNNIEFDLVGTKEETVYIFEIKWRNKKTSYNDIDNLVQKTNKSEFSTQKIQLFFISKSGYTQSAIELASHNKIALLDGHLEEIKAIGK
ncbi:MAG: hypothetical protein C5S43_04230 [Candidatus Methanocomedens sp.]|nr:MAG: hypothetical protein C5S43_04230 [ANME-2 cluster archaeon]